MGKICEITIRLHQKGHRLASPRRLVLQVLQVSRQIIQKIVLHRDNHKIMSLQMQNHTHTQITVIIDTSEQGYNVAISS
jgi:hypothetical protein